MDYNKIPNTIKENIKKLLQDEDLKAAIDNKNNSNINALLYMFSVKSFLDNISILYIIKMLLEDLNDFCKNIISKKLLNIETLFEMLNDYDAWFITSPNVKSNILKNNTLYVRFNIEDDENGDTRFYYSYLDLNDNVFSKDGYIDRDYKDVHNPPLAQDLLDIIYDSDDIIFYDGKVLV